ncbi:MAG: hypothetical protein R2844_12820 [Caldilineales bacterium]
MTDPIDTGSPEAGPSSGDDGLARSLMRLSLGGLVVGARVVRRPSSLREVLAPPATTDEAGAAPPEDQSAAGERLDSALGTAVGAAIATQRLVSRGVGKSVAVNKQVWNATAPLRKPLDWIGVTGLVSDAAGMLAIQVDRLEQTGRVEILESREEALAALTTVIDAVVAYLGQSPAVVALVQDLLQEIIPELASDPIIDDLVDEQLKRVLPELADDATVQALIRKQASNYLFYLQSHPEQVEALIRTQGDTYIAYLNQHPDNVQTLIQGQSLGLAGQVMDGVRERTVTADTVAEMVARRLLRRAPRTELPPPSHEIMRRAGATVVPSDFIREEDENTDGW